MTLQIAVDSDMPLLLVRDPVSGVRSGADQGTPSRHGMVHFSDTLLTITHQSSQIDDRFNFSRVASLPVRGFHGRISLMYSRLSGFNVMNKREI